MRLARAAGDDAAGQAGAGHGQPPSQCWPPRPGRRLLARRRGGMGARSQVVVRARVVWAAPPRPAAAATAAAAAAITPHIGCCCRHSIELLEISRSVPVSGVGAEPPA